jgi:hypothetical protein
MRKKWECFVKWIKEYGVYPVFIIVVFIFVVDIFILYFSTFGFTLGDDKGDWGTFGDFIGGTLNPILSFFGFIALLYTVRMQRKQLDDTDKFQAKQQFENTFFELLKLHNENLNKLCDLPNLSDITKNVFSIPSVVFEPSYITEEAKDCKAQEYSYLCLARKNFEKTNQPFLHYFRILHQLLKFIATNAPNSGVSFEFKDDELKREPVPFEKMYSNMVRSMLSDDIVKLLAVHCFRKESESSYYKFKLLIERYSFFENELFKSRHDSVETSLIFHDIDRFYGDSRAFGNLEH